MFWKFLVSHPKIMNLIKITLKRIMDSNKVPKFIKKIVGKIAFRFVLGVMPHLFNAVLTYADKHRPKTVSNELQGVLGYSTSEHLSDRQKVAINVQMKTQNHDCKTGKCVLTLTGEGCSPFETIRCETCNTNICSLTVCHFTKNFHKKYMQ